MGLLKKAQTAAMNRISGVRKLRAPSHEGHLPEYGVPCAKEVAVYMQQVRDGCSCTRMDITFAVGL